MEKEALLKAMFLLLLTLPLLSIFFFARGTKPAKIGGTAMVMVSIALAAGIQLMA